MTHESSDWTENWICSCLIHGLFATIWSPPPAGFTVSRRGEHRHDDDPFGGEQPPGQGSIGGRVELHSTAWLLDTVTGTVSKEEAASVPDCTRTPNIHIFIFGNGNGNGNCNGTQPIPSQAKSWEAQSGWYEDDPSHHDDFQEGQGDQECPPSSRRFLIVIFPLKTLCIFWKSWAKSFLIG